jgi:acetyltransferase-like isoleucine patch superfamily enzyme
MDVEGLYAVVRVAPTALVGEHCTLGYPKEARVRAFQETGTAEPAAPVEVGDRCLLFNQVVVYEGVAIGAACVVEDRVRVGYDCQIGAGTRLMYGAYVCDRVQIGVDARIAGFVCDGSRIGARSTVMGSLTHEYTRPHEGWFGTVEADPVVEEDCVVGYGAVVVGGVRVGPQSYVAAGAVVTRDVPAQHVVTGFNAMTPADRWPGRRLQELIEHWQRPVTGSPVDER